MTEIKLSGFSAQYRRRDYEYNMEVLHRHASYEIYILEEGRRRLFIGNRVYDTVENDAALLSPNTPHRSRGSEPHGGICVSFTDEYLDRYFTPAAKAELLECFAKEIVSLSADEERQARLLLCGENAAEPVYLRLARLLSLLGSRAKAAEKAVSEPEEIPPVIAYINKNYRTLKGLEDVAGAFYMSKSALCRKFKGETGMTVIQYLNRVRIVKACELLDSPSLSVSEVSERCGYESQAYFSRTFRRLMGCSPLEFRANHSL